MCATSGICGGTSSRARSPIWLPSRARSARKSPRVCVSRCRRPTGPDLHDNRRTTPRRPVVSQGSLLRAKSLLETECNGLHRMRGEGHRPRPRFCARACGPRGGALWLHQHLGTARGSDAQGAAGCRTSAGTRRHLGGRTSGNGLCRSVLRLRLGGRRARVQAGDRARTRAMPRRTRSTAFCRFTKASSTKRHGC